MSIKITLMGGTWLGLGKLNCLNQDKAVELLGGATRERERSWKEEERRGHTAMASLNHS